MKRLVLILTLCCAISPVAAPSAHVDFDHACNFSRYQTYRWVAPSNVDFLNQLMQARLTGFVEEALSAKHLRRVETGGDLLVNFQMNARQEKIYTTLGDGFGWDSGWGSGVAVTTEQVITLGTLTVDVVDSHSNRLVFEGVSTAPISSKPAHNTKRLAKAVSEIFEKYPPR
jgi:Domain of unknown function (DUF4136)